MLLKLLLYSSFLANTGIGILSFAIVFYARDVYGATSGEIGWLSSFWALSYFAGCFLLRGISVRLGAKRSLITASAGMALFSFLVFVSPSLRWIFVFYALFGFTTALFWPTLEGWLSEGYEGPLLNRRIGKFNLSWSFALVISPYIAGLLVEKNIDLSLISASAVYVFLTFSFWIISTFFLKGGEGKQKSVISYDRTDDHSTPLRYVAWLGNFSTYMVNGIILFVFPLYARDVLSFSESSIGLLFLMRALLSTVVFVAAAKTVWWHFNKIQMLSAQLILAVFCFLMPVVTSWMVMAAMLSAFGILFAVHYSNSLFHGVSGSINREGRMAVHEAVLTAGIITGALSGGELYQRWGMEVVFTTAGFLLLLILAVELFISGNSKRIRGII